MAGYTERPAFLQTFQIILTVVALTLQSYSFYVDSEWNSFVKKHGTFRACSVVTKTISKEVYKASISRLIANKASVQIGKDDSFWTSANKVRDANKIDERVDKDFYKAEIYRKSAGERTSLGLVCISFILLFVHLCAACWSSNYEYRTKWAAAVQGTIIYFASFAGIFLAISAYNIDMSYHRLAEKFPAECKLLLLCRNNIFENNPNSYKHFLLENGFINNNESKNFTQDGFMNRLDKLYVCQQFQMKIGAAAICGCLAIICCIIICHAMEMTTIYDEEDVDEEERARRQAFHLQNQHLKRRMTRGADKSAANSKSQLQLQQNKLGDRKV